MGETVTTKPRSASPLARAWSDRLSGLAASTGQPEWLGAIRASAAEAFLRNGLPGNKDEAWKYTSLRRLETLAPELRDGPGEAVQAEPVPVLPGLDGFGFCWQDGRIEISDVTLPQGVTLLRLEDALRDGGTLADRLRRLFESVEIAGRSRAFEALNTALLGQGVLLHVERDVDAGQCLAHWSLAAGAEPGLHNVRLCVVLEPGAQLRLVEQHGGSRADQVDFDAEPAQSMNLLFQADVGAGASLEHVRVQNERADGVLLTFADVHQAASSRYRYSGFDTGGGLVRHAVDCRLNGAGAHAVVQGAFVADKERHVDYHICVDHRAPECSSEQFFRAVLGGHSRGVFNGKAVIQAGADGSSVRQSNANLLLSREAEMDAKPELEIYADEVEASHGATVGQLDEAAVFYLRTRGLSEQAARRMLTTAFCRAVADRLDDAELAQPIADLLESAMPESDL